MDKQNSRTVTAIVPAFNEAERIAPVLDILTSYKGFHEILVVDDGSTDGTEQVAKKYPVRFVRNPVNRGKGFAMDYGVSMAEGGIIFFCDADIVGLTHDMLDRIITPVVEGKLEMFIAMRNRDVYKYPQILKIVPLLGGERALTKRLWFALPDFYKYRFRVETGLNFFAKHFGNGLDFEVFKDLTQIIKEVKFGWVEGKIRRMRMYYDIFIAHLRFTLLEVPEWVKMRRSAVASLAYSLIAFVLGLFSFACSLGPSHFIDPLFAIDPFIADEFFEQIQKPMENLTYYLTNDVQMIIGITGITFSGGMFLRFFTRLRESLRISSTTTLDKAR